MTADLIADLTAGAAVLAAAQDVRLAGVPLAERVLALAHCTVEELAAAHAAGLAAVGYAAARELGVPHPDVLAAAAAGVDPYEYGRCRAAGDSHAEALDGLAGVPRYAGWRAAGAADHATVCAAHAAGLSFFCTAATLAAFGALLASGVAVPVLRIAARLTGGDWAAPSRLTSSATVLAPRLAGAPEQVLAVAEALADGWRGSAAELAHAAWGIAHPGPAVPGGQ